MGHDPDREPPFFFMKPADAIVADGGDFAYPSHSQDVHHELELVVALGSGGSAVPAARALDLVYGYAVGLDMTRRDLQGEAKKMGRPWDTGKAFDGSAPCSPIRRASEIGHPTKGADLARGERDLAAARGPVAAHLEDSRDDRVPVERSSPWRPATSSSPGRPPAWARSTGATF